MVRVQLSNSTHKSKSMLKLRLFLVAGLSVGIVSVNAQQPGQLDPTFGSGGKVITHIGGPIEGSDGSAIAVYPNGDFMVAGSHTTYDPSDTIEPYNKDILIVRYKPDGALDITFGSNGIVTMDLGMGDEYINAVALQTDGKVVLVGSAGVDPPGVDPDFDFLLLRLNTNGTPDISFGLNGIVIPPSSGSGHNWLHSVAVQPDGRIVIAGRLYNVSHWDFFIARYLDDGMLDPTFGIVVADFPIFSGLGNDIATSIAIAADGKLVVGGYTQKGGLSDFAVARYNPDGSLDNTFGVGGMVTTDFNSKYERAFSLVIAPDGKILLAGNVAKSGLGDSNVLGMARYNPDGSLDASFGNNGKVLADFGNAPSTWSSLALQDTSRIVVAGTVQFNFSDFAVRRYLPTGVPDGSFGTNGIAITDLFERGDQASAIGIQFDSKILAAGSSDKMPSGIGVSVARYYGHITVGVPNQVGGLAPAIYPNPAHESVTLRYELTQPEAVTIRLLDLNGRLIHTFMEEKLQPTGGNTVLLDLPTGLMSGMYLLDIKSESASTVVKVVID